MKWYAIHNGKRINYFLGIALALDQLLHAFVPRSDIDRTCSHRLGLKKIKIAVRNGWIDAMWLKRENHPLPKHIKVILYGIELKGWAGYLDRGLSMIDKNHSVDAVGQ